MTRYEEGYWWAKEQIAKGKEQEVEALSLEDGIDPDAFDAGAREALRDKDDCLAVRETQHVCGLQGYNPAVDSPCPGCEARRGSDRTSDV